MTESDDADRLVDLRRRIDAGRVRIEDARKKGFDVAAWEAQWQAMRTEYEVLADRVFSPTRSEAA